MKCGIVFSRYEAAQEAAAKQPAIAAAMPAVESAALLPSAPATPGNDALTELKYRMFALPVALIVAYWAAGTGLNMVSSMLAMVVHESGHATTAWLAGRWAVPTFWVTMRGERRSWFVILTVTSAVGFGGFLAWKARRWGWLCAAGAVLVLQITVLRLTPFKQDAMIVFFGDGGAMVLATILMATFYASRESKLYQSWGVRWGLLAIGALAFMHVFRLWSGPYENIPFGEIEGVNLSDPSLLTTMYGWSITQLVDRYLLLARLCFAAMIALYLWGLLSAYAEVQVAKNRNENVEQPS